MLSFLARRFRPSSSKRNARRRPTLTLIGERTADWAHPSARVTSDSNAVFAASTLCFGHEFASNDWRSEGTCFVVEDVFADRESWSTTWAECEAPPIDGLNFERFAATLISEPRENVLAGPSDEEIIRYLDDLNRCIVETLSS